MADILFAGCVAAVALYLLKQKPEQQPGAAGNIVKNEQEQGAMLPTNNSAEASDSATANTMNNPPDELLLEDAPEGWSEDYTQNKEFMDYLETSGGISAFSQ